MPFDLIGDKRAETLEHAIGLLRKLQEVPVEKQAIDNSGDILEFADCLGELGLGAIGKRLRRAAKGIQEAHQRCVGFGSYLSKLCGSSDPWNIALVQRRVDFGHTLLNAGAAVTRLGRSVVEFTATKHRKPRKQLNTLDDPIPVPEIVRVVGRKAGRSDHLAQKMARLGYPTKKIGRKWHCQRADAIRMFGKSRQRIEEI